MAVRNTQIAVADEEYDVIQSFKRWLVMHRKSGQPVDASWVNAFMNKYDEKHNFVNLTKIRGNRAIVVAQPQQVPAQERSDNGVGEIAVVAASAAEIVSPRPKPTPPVVPIHNDPESEGIAKMFGNLSTQVGGLTEM